MFFFPFFLSAQIHISFTHVPERMVGDEDVSISNDEESSTSISAEVDSTEIELYRSMPQVDFNSLRDDNVLDWWRSHKSMFPNLGEW